MKNSYNRFLCRPIFMLLSDVRGEASDQFAGRYEGVGKGAKLSQNIDSQHSVENCPLMQSALRLLFEWQLY